MTFEDLLVAALEPAKWFHLAELPSKFKKIDPLFNVAKYKHEKMLPLLASVPKIIEIKKNDAVTPPSYQCRLVDNGTEPVPSKVSVINENKDFMKKSLFKRVKLQPNHEVFAHFGYDARKGETWDTPFEKLAAMVKPEPWNFQSDVFRRENDTYYILRSYLNYTFLRLQEEGKIVYSSDGNRACFNTGLQTTEEKDVFASFYRNRKRGDEYIEWIHFAFFDSYSNKLNDFSPTPEVATYIDDASDLVFDLSYELEINVGHIVKENIHRFPEVVQDNPRLAMNAMEGAKEFLKEKIRRNYKIAIPHWYENKIQLLLPLNLLSDDKADVALVADKDKAKRMYRIKTVLSMDMAYLDARLICRPDREWLDP